MSELKSRLETVEERIIKMKNRSEVIAWNVGEGDGKLERKGEIEAQEKEKHG